MKQLARRTLTFVLVFAMLLSTVAVTALADETAAAGGGTKYVLDAADIEVFAAGERADGEAEAAGTDNYFTILWRGTAKVENNSAGEWADGYVGTRRLNPAAVQKGEDGVPTGAAIKFTTGAAATVKVWWKSNQKEMAILDSTGAVVATVTQEDKNEKFITEFELPEAGTYYLANVGGTNYIFKVEVEESAASTEYILDAADVDLFASGDKSDGEAEIAGTDNFFTILWRGTSKVEDNSAGEWPDGYVGTRRLNPAGLQKGEDGVPTGAAIKFTTTGAATVKVWWKSNQKEMAIIDSTGATVASVTQDDKNEKFITEFELPDAGTYYLTNVGGTNYIFKVSVTVGGGERAPRADWAEVAAPEITGVAVNGGSVAVTVSAEVGYDAADSVTVTMTAPDGTETTQTSLREQAEHTLTFTPADSGTYTFSVAAARSDEEEVHAGAKTASVDFVFPLTAPVIKGAYNDGSGTVTVEWNAVHEAEGYTVTAGGKTQTVTGLSATFEGLTVGEEVTFTVAAVRGGETGPESSVDKTVEAERELRWAFAAFGNSTNTADNSFSGSFNDGEIRVWSKGGKGKIQESSHDGIAFYYTVIDPKTQNFVLEATVHVNEWTYSNGQEAFGLAALDRVGVHGNSGIFYNNSYMTAITRLTYKDDAGLNINLRQGAGAILTYGTTRENQSNPEGDGYSRTVLPLDHTFDNRAGTYNVVGNATNQSSVTGNIDDLLTDFTLRLEKNNTGYFMTYIAPDGTEFTVKSYDPENLTVLDDLVYVGFFAARNFDVTFTDITFTTSDPATDAPAEERPAEYVAPSYGFSDRGVSNSPEGELIYRGSVDGTAVITDAAGSEIYNGPVTANKNLFIDVALTEGENVFTVTVTPDPDFHPDGLSYRFLESYDAWTGTQTITYKVDDRDVVYVGPNGRANAAGTRTDPTTLAAAIEWAAPGQTIILLAGTYDLTGTITILRGINGTAEEPITLMADPLAVTRPVLCVANKITLEANYWHFIGFDVTGSSGNGIHVAGSHNTIERVNTYKNGNTGLQISRQGNFDGIDEWPSYNLILNCSSYLNADPGYEDADGFAAKLTVGEGNVFEGCISAYNADDGWDLFARGESIGTVTIKDSIAFKNGWILDEKGNEINAGNGNGFKMGGSGYEGGHVLENSIAFANKANGITCNSCPDIKVYNSISYDNGGSNLTVYSSIDGQSTDFAIEGYISFGTSGASSDSIKPAGDQTLAELQSAGNYYLPDGNTAGVKAAAEWFKSLDTAAALAGGISRNADGTISMNGYLELTDAAPADAGARLPGAQGFNYRDILPSAWYYEAAAALHERNIMLGTGASEFDPGETTTRGMVAVVLHRIAGTPVPKTASASSDVTGSEWFAEAVSWAEENEIMAALDGKFDPDGTITRQDAVKALYLYAVSKGLDEDVTGSRSLEKFTDAGELSEDNVDAMTWAVNKAIINGTSATTLSPNDSLTRAELATILYRFLTNVA